ncbi:hypothetical protein Q3O60_00875 [Alkalimonas collagenimarina]|uniref:Uncharacterized protein n=1 Tax=Alkalimonas collagenimarina TaxID=400390 RepID=A0ABT9GUP5_9GAMM|nr:hypothetical protein [Alkalimonas collagenimarina]MDP4534746.1 hypothetical protein [Alkalimonas collagenimarina]
MSVLTSNQHKFNPSSLAFTPPALQQNAVHLLAASVLAGDQAEAYPPDYSHPGA